MLSLDADAVLAGHHVLHCDRGDQLLIAVSHPLTKRRHGEAISAILNCRGRDGAVTWETITSFSPAGVAVV